MDLPSKDVFCHRTGFEKNCRELVASGKCNRWIGIAGRHPQTGETFSRHDCIDNWTPVLLMDSAKLQSETGAEVNRLRNEVAEANGARVSAAAELRQALTSSIPPRLINGGGS